MELPLGMVSKHAFCYLPNYISSGNLNSQKDHEDEVFSLEKYITFRPKMY